MRKLRFGLAAAAGLVQAAIAVALVWANDRNDDPWLTGALAVTAGLSFVAAGLVALWRRPDNTTGFLLAATGYLWFLGALTESSNEWVFTTGFVLGNFAFVAFAAAILSYPDGTLTRLDKQLVTAAGAVAIGANVLGALVVEEHSGCDGCPGSAIAVLDRPGLENAIDLVATVIVVPILVAIVVILVKRWVRASAAQRRVYRPVFGACVVAMSLLALGVPFESIDESGSDVVWDLFLLAFAAVPLTFLAGVLRVRRDRAAVAEMLLSLDAGVPLREALAQALHDPSLEIAYWLDDSDRWVDPDGRQVEPPQTSETRSVTTVEHNGRRVAALLHDPVLDEEPQLVEMTAAAAGLSLQNERLQADLRAQYAFLETVANTAPSLLVVVGPDGRIRNQNRATVIASGLGDEEQIRGRFFWDVFIDPSERDEMRARFDDAAPDFPPASYENTFTNACGDRLVIAWESAPVVDESGQVVSIVAGGLDITERKQRELELQRERDATTTILQTIPSLIAVLDAGGAIVDRDLDNPLAAVNQAFRETLGWRDAELVGRSFEDLVHHDDAAGLTRALGAAAAGATCAELESRWRRADGRFVDVAWIATPVADATGRRSRLILVSGSDVTERRRQEEQIRFSRARIVEAGDEARRRLERDLHDGAQQRLVAISVSLRLAEARLAADPAAAEGILVAARAELAHALDELRELARGIHPAVLTERGLAAAIDALVLRSPFPVETNVAEERLPPQVEAAVYYVVAEALTNVAKYAPGASAQVHVERLDGVVRVEIADDGPGGAVQDAGSGLRGLADRVATLEGTLDVFSPTGEGTRILAELPVSEHRAPAPDPGARIPVAQDPRAAS